MSDIPYLPPQIPPLMTAERARDLARSYKGWAEHLVEYGLQGAAARAERDGQWWMTYSIALAHTLPKSE